MAIKKKTLRKRDGGDETAKSTSYTIAKTRKQLNKEKADAIRAGYGAKQPTARDARKAKRSTKAIGKMAKSVGKRASGGFSCKKGKAATDACGRAAQKHGFSTVNKKSRTAKRATKKR